MLIIRKANYKDKINIESLREASYNKSSYLTPIKTSYNEWSNEDDISTIFIAEDNDDIVATARIKIINNASELEKRNRILNTQIEYPLVLIDQTATKTNMQNMGLNTLIRFVIISFAKTIKIQSIIGLVNKDSPRYMSMLKYKYTSKIAELTNDYSDYLINHTTPMLLELHKDNFDDALDEIKKSKAYKAVKFVVNI